MAREYVEKNTAEMVRCLKELVAIPGIFEDAPSKGAPFGKNIQKSLEYVLRMGQQMGFQVKNYDGYAGEITAGEGNRMIGILCHTDVVSQERDGTQIRLILWKKMESFMEEELQMIKALWCLHFLL